MPTKASAIKVAATAGAGLFRGATSAAATGGRGFGPTLVANPKTGALGKWVPIGWKRAKRSRPRGRGPRADPLTKMLPTLVLLKLFEK